MRHIENSPQGKNIALSWKRLLIQGVIIMLIGLTMSLSSLLKTDTIIMSARGFSLLPVGGMVIFILGLQECLEAFFAKDSREFHQNLQVGILDTVVGGLIIFSVSDEPQRLSLMLAAFLITRGAVRLALVQALRLPHVVSTSLCGIVSIIAGILICFEWPTNEGWFLSLCLNLEITFRGWAIMMFGLWVKKKNNKPIA